MDGTVLGEVSGRCPPSQGAAAISKGPCSEHLTWNGGRGESLDGGSQQPLGPLPGYPDP